MAETKQPAAVEVKRYLDLDGLKFYHEKVIAALNLKANVDHAHGNITKDGILNSANGAAEANKIVVTDAAGKITADSNVSLAELGYLKGVTSAVQAQITTISEAEAANAGTIAEHTQKIGTIEGNYTTLNGKVDDIDTAYKEADTAIKGRLDGVETKLKDVTNVMDFVGAVETLPTSTAGYQKGDVIVVISTHKEYVFNGTEFVEFGDASAESGAITDLTGRIDALEKKPAAGITGTQITNWDKEVGGKAVADQNKIDLDALTPRVAANEQALAKKVEQDAFDTLNDTVTNASTGLVKKVGDLETTVGNKAEASDLTELANAVNDPATGLATKASDSEFQAVKTAVNSTSDGLATKAPQSEITRLEGLINDKEGAMTPIKISGADLYNLTIE